MCTGSDAVSTEINRTSFPGSLEAEERTRAGSVSQEANAAKDRECAIPSPLLCGCEDGSGMGEGHRVGRDFKASC